MIGYHTRNNLPLDEHLLARVRIVPGRGDAVLVYGGGLTESRIVIPTKLLVLALAPAGRPHDYAAPRVSILSWTHWNVGLVMSSEPGAPDPTPEQRQPSQLATESEYERVMIGEPPTLGYVVEPAALDERKNHRPHDDPMWLDWDPGDEHDGTDAGDRDFLFGLLVEALGVIRRHEDRVATLRALVPWLVRAKPVHALARTLGRAHRGLADEHAALGGARHHLIQYLAWQLWRREDLLTARAYAPELVVTTRRIVGELGAAKDREVARRIERLAAHVAGVPAPRPTKWGRIAVGAVAVACLGAATFAIVNAVSYHPTYEEHLKVESHGKAK